MRPAPCLGLLFAALAATACGARPPTFSRDIAALVHDKCAPCHHPDGAGPFSLVTYREVAPRAAQISRVTESRFMPPWKPVAGHGRYANDRSLAPAQIALLRRW